MLARVPLIPSLDLGSDAPHQRVWAIVLTGDEAPLAGHALRPRNARTMARRWPLSPEAPSRLGQVLEHASHVAPPGQMVTVVTRRQQAAWERELAGLPHTRPVVQPSYRGRAAEVLLPLLKIARRDPSATIVVLPADHRVDHHARFLRYVSRAVWAVALRPDLPILIGAHPQAPLADGWIELGPFVDGLEELTVRAVKRFVDDAVPSERRRLFESNALTSTGIIVGRAATLVSVASRVLPEVLEALEPLVSAFGAPEESLLREAVYECMPQASLGALERAHEMAVLPLPGVVWRAPERDALLLAS